jgi:hypothetical protein
MRKTKILENGFAYGGGKYMPWELCFDALVQVTDAKTIEKIQKGISERVRFDAALTLNATEELGEVLGVKMGQQYDRRLKEKMKKLNGA